MVDKSIYRTFKKGSKTFFTTSLFFPASVRDDIFIFYAFVRVADDMVDAIPPRLTEFEQFKTKYAAALAGNSADDIIIDSFVVLVHRRSIPHEWIDAFLRAMSADTYKKTYNTLGELGEYMYGSAEVVGLVMAQLLELPTKSYETAQTLGRAFQYINFLRDIAEDIELGRQYIPLDVLAPFGFSVLTEETARANPDGYRALIRHELERYRTWQKEGEAGFVYIPKRSLIPIRTASEMYRYTANEIEKDPFVIFRKKVKPNTFYILRHLIANVL